MEPVELVESKELMDQIQQDLASHDVPTIENALERLAHVTFPKESQYAMSISRRILDLLERKAIRFTDANVRSAINATFAGLENREIIECIDRVLGWPVDYSVLLTDLIDGIEPTDSAAEYMIPRIRLVEPLSEVQTVLVIRRITERFHDFFSRRQIDDFLAYLLKPDGLNAPPGPDGTVNYDFDNYDLDDTPAFRAFCAVNNLMPHLSSANWKTIGNYFFQLNYTPVELVPLLYDKQPPQGVDVDALILACYEVACDFRHINGASYEALEVLMRRQTEMDDRLLAKIATLIIGNLGAEIARDGYLDDHLRVREGSAALVNEVLRLQTGGLWNAPLLNALFETFRVAAQLRSEPTVQEFRALLKFPAWPRELLRQHISVIVHVVLVSFRYSKVTQEFWIRLCREYPAPEMELLDAFSELVENGNAFSELVGKGVLEDNWEALETILGSRAYQAASPGPDSLFWQRLRAKIEPFLDFEEPQKRSRASALLAQYSSGITRR